MSYKGIMSQDRNSNFPSAAFEALQKRKVKERSEVINKAHSVENTSNMALKTRMTPPKKSLKPRKMGK